MSGPIMVVSGSHDWRSRRRVGFHKVLGQIFKGQEKRFLSVGFSHLSELKGTDARLNLLDRKNVVELVDGVHSYLWHTPFHGVNLPDQVPGFISKFLFEFAAYGIPDVPRNWFETSSVIIVESGYGVLFTEAIRKLNRNAIIVYWASDDLETIGASPYLVELLARFGHFYDLAVVPSALLNPAVKSIANIVNIPHGVDPNLRSLKTTSPFVRPRNAVSVGSMLFDSEFIEIVSELFEDVEFHVIGSGQPKSAFPRRVKWHAEMKFDETIPYLQHATIGLAPYLSDGAPYYMKDTSLKLQQYEYLGLPAVCPDFATDRTHPTRFGYRQGDVASIHRAIESALKATRTPREDFLDWREVASLFEATVIAEANHLRRA